MKTNPGQWAALASELSSALGQAVRFDDGHRAAYASDSSNYRQVPIGVVVPRTLEDFTTAVAICRRHKAPVLMH
jgi:FAD/FMN-containing dehydrogenase